MRPWAIVGAPILLAAGDIVRPTHRRLDSPLWTSVGESLGDSRSTGDVQFTAAALRPTVTVGVTR